MTVLINKDVVREPLYAIVPVQNAWRYKSRYKHTERAIKHFADAGAVVVLVEVAFNRREFVFADSGLDGAPSNCRVYGTDADFRHRYVPLRSRSELWLKENSINVAVARALPYDWRQVCWPDSDVHWVRPNWVGECIQQLQHYDFLQMFSHARDLSPDYEVMPETYPHADGLGFVAAFNKGLFDPKHRKHHPHPPHPKPPEPPTYPYESALGLPRVFPGLAWACTREAWDGVGGLLDFAVWGGGDWHMAHCLVGKSDGMMRNDLHPTYQGWVQNYFDLCNRHVRQKYGVGMMTGSIFHMWHGRKAERGYNLKHALLAQAGFDPLKHLKKDYQGLWQLENDGSGNYETIRDTFREIARMRNEDSEDTRIDLMEQGH
jgi:hypothetical protein